MSKPNLKPNPNLNQPGVKDDATKIRVGLMVSGFSNALHDVAKVTTFGASKYTPNGWTSVPNAGERYYDAMHRHLLAAESSEVDSESDILHLTHAAWNILAIIELKIRKETHKKSPSSNT
jgi:Domain of unknown function (DUF5664)